MGLVDKLGWTKYWNQDINKNKWSPEWIFANTIVTLIIFSFVSLFFVFALIGIGIIFFVLFLVSQFWSAVEITGFGWMLYGLILGVSFSFFAQAIPSRKDIETPAEIYKSFSHHFTYFMGFFLSVEVLALIITVIIAIYQAFT